MKVLDKQEADFDVQAGDLAPGDAFEWEGRKMLCVESDDVDLVGAVDLLNGDEYSLARDELVMPRPDAEVVFP